MGDHRNFTTDRQEQRQPAMSSGLARYQSAPSSYFASLMSSNNISNFHQICDEFINPSSSKTDQVFSPYMPAGGSDFMAAPIKSESETYVHDQQQLQGQGRGYSSASRIIHQNQSQPSMPNRSLPMSNPTVDSSYLPQMNTGGGRNTNLLRQSSSPANFFSDFDIQGYNVSKSMGSFGTDKGSNLETSVQSPNRLKSQLDFPSGLPSSSGIMTSISEIENKNMEISNTSFPFTSWDDSDIFSDNFLKGLENDDRKSFASKNENDGVGNHRPPTMLSHHLSLPKASAKMSSIEKFLELQDSVPCKIRAKRGCATHPRSIAERVRRTRISERMRKLQELVPNMDKQTNTSDMLDLAVDYIKDLQDQVQTLSSNRAKCTCSNQQTQ